MAQQYFAVERHKFRDFQLIDDQFDVLEACIMGEVSPEEAAKRLTAHVEASSTPFDMQQRLGALWELLNRTAVKLPSSQYTIISILQIIKTFPKVEEPKGEGEEYMNLDGGDIWSELTDWGDDWSDQFNSCCVSLRHHTPTDNEDLEARKALLINGFKFQARLSATDDKKLSTNGHGIVRGSHMIVDALEVEHEGEGEEGKPNDTNVEAAAQLFIYAAPQIYHHCRESYEKGLYHYVTKDDKKRSDLWEGKPGFSEERWRLWKERWAVLANGNQFSEEARAAAKEALKAMEVAESSS